MPALPAAASFTGSSITEAQFKSAITDMREYLAGLLGTTGAIPAAQAALDVIFGAGVVAKSGAYAVAAADRGKLINCTGTWTMTLLAAATAGAGFAFAVRNSGTGVITIDGNAAELIDGASTITLAAGASAVIVCTGTAWLSVGLAAPIDYPISVANGGTGSGATPTVSNSPQADNIKAVKHDHGYNNIGSLCYAVLYLYDGSANPGGTMSGAQLRACCIKPVSGVLNVVQYGTAMSGSWRCLGYAPATLTSSDRLQATLWQRIS